MLGRLASKVASILRGKEKATFTPHMDMGDNVIIINAEKVYLTGGKRENKTYYWHTFLTKIQAKVWMSKLSANPSRFVKTFVFPGLFALCFYNALLVLH